MMELIRLENITKTYHVGEVDVPVLKGVSLSIARGEMVALMGASGSGKTTLMNILGCLDRPSSGCYWLDSQEMSRLTPNQRALVRTAKLGFVFQSFNLLPRTTAVQNVLMPLDYAPRRVGGDDARRLSRMLLERVGLADRCEHEPSQMSGGQQQRVAIARALVNHPALLLADEPTGNLDSRTSVEILRMFQTLNAEGLTVILVTHDAKVAAYAHRTIRIADGLIEEAESNVSSTQDDRAIPQLHPHRIGVASAIGGNGSAKIATTRTIAHRHAADGHRTTLAIATAVRTAAAGVPHERVTSPTARAHGGPHSSPRAEAEAKPRRAAAAPVLPSTLPHGLRRLAAEQDAIGPHGSGRDYRRGRCDRHVGDRSGLQDRTAENHRQHGGQQSSDHAGLGHHRRRQLRLRHHPIADPWRHERDLPAVSCGELRGPHCLGTAQVIYGNRNWIPRNMTGTTSDYLTVRDWEDLEEGNAFTDGDVQKAAKVCLIGTTLKRELFQDESPVGKEVRIQNVPFRVVGVLSRKGANMMGQDQDDIVLAPWTTMKFRVNGSGAGSTTQITSATANALTAINTLSNLYPGGTGLYPAPTPTEVFDVPQAARRVNVDQLLAKAVSEEQIPKATREIADLLRERHHLPPLRDNDFDIRDMTEVARTMSSASELMEALLLVVAAISLVVGGVGIMNIMLVSVTERTREIGLRMAVGARSHHILRQFLIEAVLLCLTGGAIGILAGRATSVLVRSLKNWPTQASFSAIVVAVMVSAGVGIIFGFYPAWKASRLDPIEALRYE